VDGGQGDRRPFKRSCQTFFFRDLAPPPPPTPPRVRDSGSATPLGWGHFFCQKKRGWKSLGDDE
jgi:hypothetical protein